MTEQADHDPGADGLARAAQAAAMSLSVIEALARLQRERAARQGMDVARSPTPTKVEARGTEDQRATRPRKGMPFDVLAPATDASSAAVNSTATVTSQSTDAARRAQQATNGPAVALSASDVAPTVPPRLVPPRPTHRQASRRR